MKNNFLGQDGFVWWIGVVESRNDPLKLGRCKVRIFGFHSEKITDQPTEDLPWAHPIIPLDSGKNTIGPVESQWVFGFFGDAQNAQKPYMMGVMPTMRDTTAPDPNEQIGFQDLRTDDSLEGHNQPFQPKYGDTEQRIDGYGTTLAEAEKVSRYPDINELKEPLTSRFARGFQNGIVLTTDGIKLPDSEKDTSDDKETTDEGIKGNPSTDTTKTKKEKKPGLELGSLVFQNIDGDISTSEGQDAILRSGGYEAAGTVLWEEGGQIFLVDVFGKFKKGTVFTEDGSTHEVTEVRPQPMGHLYRTILRPKILNALKQKYIPIAETKEAQGEFAIFKVNVGGSFSEPIPPYNTQYPYNHVYESESGHLLEFDDTPGFERIQLLHRSGTFEEVHPNGLKVEKVVNDHYTYNLKNRFIHTDGKEYHTIDKAYKLLINTDADTQGHWSVLVGPNGDVNICTADGKINFYSTQDFNIFAEGDINFDAENIRMHSRKDMIIHNEGNVDWHVEKNKKLNVDIDFTQTIGHNKLSMISHDYRKVIGDDYDTNAGGIIFEGSSGSNTTRSGSSIQEFSLTGNLRLSALSITDITSSCLLLALSNTSVLGSDIDVVLLNDSQFVGGDIMEMSDGIIREVSPMNSKASLTYINVGAVGVTAMGSMTISGFITSNGILHGSTYV